MHTIIERLSASVSDRYRIDREIGVGGMATVYLAQDVRHDRRVALKVLNPELGAVLGVERFLAEIKVTANLQHPNLLPLFDSGEASGLLFYVMPFVEGESLRAKLDREKQLPIDEAVRMAVAVANALDYAHQHNVIHRDLKPENVLLQAGQPVVADFGIALAVSNAGGNRVTQTGLSLGTPQYMSPEQATGDRVIDARTDIYSLGAIMYEMLTGEPPHLGNTAQAIIARLLTDRPHGVRTARPAVPEHIEAAVAKALEKLPADRFSTGREFAEAIQGRGSFTASSLTSARTAAGAPSSRPSRLRDPVVIGLGVATVVAIASAAWIGTNRENPVPPPTVRFIVSTTDSTRPLDNVPWPAAISPDGGTMVYTVGFGRGDRMLYKLGTDQLRGSPIPGTENGFQPTFSPDGQWLAFQVTGKERKVRLDGSAPVAISDGGSANGADWTARNELIAGAWGTNVGLTRVSTAGGIPVALTVVDTSAGDVQHVWPVAAPDGDFVVFSTWTGSQQTTRIAMADVPGGEVTRLGIVGLRPLAVLDGHVVYLQSDGTIMAIAVDFNARKVTGSPIPVHDPVPVAGGANGNSGVFISSGGALINARGASAGRLNWVARDRTPVPLLPEVRAFSEVALSPDERQVAVIVSDATTSDVWIYDTRLATLSRLTSGGSAGTVKWTRDGSHVIYTSRGRTHRSGVWRQAPSGGSPAELLFERPYLISSIDMTDDERSVLISAYIATTFDLVRVAVDSPEVDHPYLATSPATEIGPAFSPDGKWVAVASDESGPLEVYIRSYPDPSARIQVSVGGGSDPFWSRDGQRLFYRAENALLAARVTRSPSFTISGRDTIIASLPTVSAFVGARLEVSRDGQRFLGVISERDDFQLVASPNWITEFRRRIAK